MLRNYRLYTLFLPLGWVQSEQRPVSYSSMILSGGDLWAKYAQIQLDLQGKLQLIAHSTLPQSRHLRCDYHHPHQTSHGWDNMYFVELNELYKNMQR